MNETEQTLDLPESPKNPYSITIPSLARPARILITGAQGIVGWNLYRLLSKQNDVRGFLKSYRGNDSHLTVGLLEDKQTISPLLDEFQPDLLIHAQVMCNLDVCEKMPDSTQAINVEVAEGLLNLVDHAKTKIIYMSSDHVFSGLKGERYQERDIPDPVSVYGRSRVMVETLMQERVPNFLIIRPGLVIGPSLQTNVGPRDWLLGRLRKDQIAGYFHDERRTPISAEDLVMGIAYLINQAAEGIYHLAGEQSLSRYDLAYRLAIHYGYAPKIESRMRSDDKDVPRIADNSLDCQKIRSLGWQTPRTIREFDGVEDAKSKISS